MVHEPEIGGISVDFTDKTAIVTGAASGIGRAVALALAASGARVLATDRTPHGLFSLANEAVDCVRPIVTWEADLLDPAVFDQIVDTAIAAGVSDGVDLIASCAGLLETSPIEEVTIESFDRVMGVNLRAPLLLMKSARPKFNPGASVVLIASGTSVGPSGYQAIYAASKAGVANLAASLAAELAPEGFRINALSPGWTDTPMVASHLADDQAKNFIVECVPDRSIGTPEQVAAATLFLLSNASTHIQGINLLMDGGFSSVAVIPPIRVDTN